MPGTPRTFSSAAGALAYLQKNYGSSIYSVQQEKRYQFYSYVQYPVAGVNVLNFFGQSMAQVTAQLTNLPQPSNLGNVSFLVQAISLDWMTLSNGLPHSYAVDADTVYSDLVHGFIQAGYFEMSIGSVVFSRFPYPLLYAPAGNGKTRADVAGFTAASSGTTPWAVDIATWPVFAEIDNRRERSKLLQNPILIEPQQNFAAKIGFDSGAVPVIGTTDINDVTNPLYVGCILDGTAFIPVQ